MTTHSSGETPVITTRYVLGVDLGQARTAYLRVRIGHRPEPDQVDWSLSAQGEKRLFPTVFLTVSEAMATRRALGLPGHVRAIAWRMEA